MADEIESLVKEFRLLNCTPLKPLVNNTGPVYITHASIGQATKALATGEASGNIRVCELDTLKQVGVIQGRKKHVTGLDFSKGNEKLLWTASACSDMNCWDLRASYTRPAHVLSSPNNSEYTCCGVNCVGDIIAAATEPFNEDVCVYVWDIRSLRPFFTSVFTDSHKEDITQVKFHPTRPKQMGSCSTDGLICLFDLSHAQEEDALQFVLNSGSSVARIGYFGEKYDKLFCITHIETLQLWDAEEATLLADHTQIRKATNGVPSADYLVDCFYHPSINKLHLVTGKHSGDLQVFEVTEERVDKIGALTGGHSATVRCLEWHPKGEQIVTGGEDSTVCCWKAASTVETIPVEENQEYATEKMEEISKTIPVEENQEYATEKMEEISKTIPVEENQEYATEKMEEISKTIPVEDNQEYATEKVEEISKTIPVEENQEYATEKVEEISKTIPGEENQEYTTEKMGEISKKIPVEENQEYAAEKVEEISKTSTGKILSTTNARVRQHGTKPYSRPTAQNKDVHDTPASGTDHKLTIQASGPRLETLDFNMKRRKHEEIDRLMTWAVKPKRFLSASARQLKPHR